MYKLKEIVLKDFFSHENTVITLPDILTEVGGINFDFLPPSSNGSGKSSFIEGIYFGITGKTLRKVNNKDIHRNGTNNTKVILKFTDEKEGALVIERELVNGTQKVKVLEDGVVNKSLKDLSPQKSNEYILKKLNLTQQDIDRYYIVTSKNHLSLLQSTPKVREEIIYEIAGIERLKGIEQDIKKDLKEEQNTLVQLQNEESYLKGSVEQIKLSIQQLKDSARQHLLLTKLQVQLKEQKQNWGKEMNDKKHYEDELKIVSTELEHLPVFDTSIYEKIENQKNIVKEQFSKETKALEQDREAIKKSIESFKTETQELFELEKTLEKSITELTLQLNNGIECPKCGALIGRNGEEINIQEVQSKLDSKERSLKECRQIREQLQKEILEHRVQIDIIEKQLSAANERFNSALMEIQNMEQEAKKKELILKGKKEQLKERIKQLQSSIKIKEDSIKVIHLTIKELEDKIVRVESGEILDPKISELLEKKGEELRKAQESLTSNENKIRNSQSKIADLTLELKLLNDFSLYLLSRIVEGIKMRSNEWLNKFGVDMELDIKMHRVLSDGTKKPGIDVQVMRRGKAESIGKFSNGELARLELCTILGIQDIYTSIKGSKLNLLVIDELLDGVDHNGFTRLVSEIKELHKPVYLVSHVFSGVDVEKINFEKRDGVTRIVK